jgi:anti-anti-sigma factor
VAVAILLDKRVLGVRAEELFDDHLFPLADALAGNGLIVDFSLVRYFGSDSFGRLLQLATRVKGAKGWLRLCGIAPGLLDVFRVTRLDTRFDIDSDLGAALEGTRPTAPG